MHEIDEIGDAFGVLRTAFGFQLPHRRGNRLIGLTCQNPFVHAFFGIAHHIRRIGHILLRARRSGGRSRWHAVQEPAQIVLPAFRACDPLPLRILFAEIRQLQRQEGLGLKYAALAKGCRLDRGFEGGVRPFFGGLGEIACHGCRNLGGQRRHIGPPATIRRQQQSHRPRAAGPTGRRQKMVRHEGFDRKIRAQKRRRIRVARCRLVCLGTRLGRRRNCRNEIRLFPQDAPGMEGLHPSLRQHSRIAGQAFCHIRPGQTGIGHFLDQICIDARIDRVVQRRLCHPNRLGDIFIECVTEIAGIRKSQLFQDIRQCLGHHFGRCVQLCLFVRRCCRHLFLGVLRALAVGVHLRFGGQRQCHQWRNFRRTFRDRCVLDPRCRLYQLRLHPRLGLQPDQPGFHCHRG